MARSSSVVLDADEPVPYVLTDFGLRATDDEVKTR